MHASKHKFAVYDHRHCWVKCVVRFCHFLLPFIKIKLNVLVFGILRLHNVFSVKFEAPPKLRGSGAGAPSAPWLIRHWPEQLRASALAADLQKHK